MDAIEKRQTIAWLGFFAVAAVLPFLVNSFYVSVLTLVLQYAFLGQAWNLMMGFAGQLSLGHALYFGLGGYAAMAVVVHFGLSPWLGIMGGGIVAAAAGVVVGALGFRFAVRGVFLALLTIALAELARILFDHWDWVGRSGGFFLPAPDRTVPPILSLRGGVTLYFYIFLALTIAAFFLCRGLLLSRVGAYWLAIREDEDAARALGVRAFRMKLWSVVISAALTGIGGGVFAFVNGSLFPRTAFGIDTSIQIMLGSIIGGLGTLFGPIIGALVVVPLGEIAKELAKEIGILGINVVIYGAVVVAILLFSPAGLWPWLAPRLGLHSHAGVSRATAAAKLLRGLVSRGR